jgi:hypothetical protein
MALISLNAIKSAFPNKVQTSDEANVTAIILAAQSIAERYTERTLFLNASKTIYLDANGDKLLLPDAPINSVASVSYDKARAFASALPSSSYFVDTVAGNILFNRTYYGDKVFKVVYSAGWAEDLAPKNIDTIMKELVYYIWKRQSKDQIGSRELTGAEGYRLVYDPSFPKFVKDMLDMERRY